MAVGNEFAGRKVLITGASRGLGAGLFQWLTAEGADVLGVGRSKPSFTVTTGTFIEADLSTDAGVADVIKHAQIAGVDTVIHGVGGGFKRSSDFITKEDFLYLLNLNFTVALELNNALVPGMIAKNRGWVIHLGSVATKELTASVGYTSVKSLVTPYVKHMGRKYLADGVYFSGVTLGAMTGFEGAIDRLQTDRPEVFESFLADRRPSQRATPVAELLPYFRLLLTDSAKVHASNMICLDEAEGKAI
jgi:NAD(P)-dependent dehydrogenase (short-subunit alcohol dehydrogenase family)